MATPTQTASTGPASGRPAGVAPDRGRRPADAGAWEPRQLAEHPLLGWWGISLLLAILSALVWPTVPSYDPFSWIVWGREVTDPHISFFIGSGPSWKPLPFAFTTVYGALGGVAPTLWVITARTGGIAGLIGVWRLSALVCRRAGLPAWAGPVAGFAAAAGIVLTAPSSGWMYYFFRGASEPLLIGVWVWAIERMVSGRHRQAYVLLAAEGLMRPEAWPFLFVYGAWLWWRNADGTWPRLREGVRGVWRPSSTRWLVALGLIAQPVGWFVPPWISTGQPFLAATHASEYNGQLGSDVLKTIVERGEGIQSLPSLAFAILGVLLALWLGRERLRGLRGARGLPGLRGLRERAVAASEWWRTDDSELPLVVGLVLASIAWWIVVIGETEDGYPGLERFYLPAAAMICVLSGYGLVRIALWLGGQLARLGDALVRPRVAVGAALVLCALFLAGSTHFLGSRWAYAKQQEPLAATAVIRIRELGQSITALGGHAKVLPCGSSVVTINHSLQTALAWKLGTTLARVQTVMTIPGIAFVGPHDAIDGGPPPILFTSRGRYVPFQTRTLARVGAWSLQQVWPVHEPRPACVGS